MLKKFSYLVCICCVFCACAVFGQEPQENTKNVQELTKLFQDSQAKINIENSGAYLSNFSFKELEEMFAYLEYDEYIKVPGDIYPRIFVKNIPYDFAAMSSATERNRVFIKILMPLVLKVNQEVLEERNNLLAVKARFSQAKDFNQTDTKYLEETAQKYDVHTPFQDTRRYMLILDELLRKVDIVPPSLLIASAAIHTNWGTSRIAIQANNLYQAKDWYTDIGLKPIGETDDSYRYKIYPNLESSIRDYVLKVNTNINYAQFRGQRETAHKWSDILYGKRLDWTFVTDSNLTNYAGLLDYTLTYYKFFYLDRGVLEEEYEFDD